MTAGCCAPAGEGDVAKLAEKLAERDNEVFHHYCAVQQANLGIHELTKAISEQWQALALRVHVLVTCGRAATQALNEDSTVCSIEASSLGQQKQ
jgi:hypothetical protein